MYDKTGHRRPPGDVVVHGLYGNVIYSEKSFFTNDLQSHPASIGVPHGHPKLTSFLGVPLVLDGKMMGMIGVANREGGYSSEQQVDLEAITPAVVQALHRKKAEIEHKQTRVRMNADLDALTRMHELSTKLLVTDDTQPLLDEIVYSAVVIVGAKFGTLQLLEDDSLRIVSHYGHLQPFLDFFASAENVASVCGEAMQRWERVIITDVETSPLFVGTSSLDVMRKAGVRAVQSTPMISRAGELFGILTTQWDVPYSPNEHDLWRIDLLARQAADMIELVKKGKELHESEERLRLLSDNLPDSALYQYVHELDGSVRFLYCSAGIEKLNSVSIQDVLHDPGTLHRQLSPEYLEQLVEIEARSARELSDFDMDVPMQLPNGQVRWMRLHSRPRRLPNGQTIWDGVQMDITKHKKAEQERETTTEFLQLVSNSNGIVDMVHSVVNFVRERSGFEAVGIRLKDSDDYAYSR
jgi:PAS domain S-box-containing protein